MAGCEHPNRREILHTVGVGGTGVLAGCLGESESEEHTRSRELKETENTEGGLISYNPYKEIDWSDVTQHKTEFHNHVRGSVSEPAEIADLYNELGYTVFSVADKGYRPMLWPWTEWSDISSEYDNREPEEMGIVAFPGCEFTMAEHVEAIFTTLDHYDAEGFFQDIGDQIAEIIEREDHHVPQKNGGLVVLNHPYRYYNNPDEDWTRYLPLFETYTRTDGFVGMEVFNKEAPNNEDVRLWDLLLTEFCPTRYIWGFANDDPNEYIVGSDVDLRWTSTLLASDEFNPNSQQESRISAGSAFREGRTLFHERETWDSDTEDPAIPPTIESIAVNSEDDEITIKASHYDSFEWISRGEAVSTDPTISLKEDYVPYVRAHLRNNNGAETSTQPFVLSKQ